MKSKHNTEEIIFQALPESPPELRRQVEQLVRKKTRRQSLIRDFQWLGLTFSALLIAVAVQWSMLATMQTEFYEFCHAEIASEQTEKTLLAHRNQAHSLDSNFLVLAQTANENPPE